MRTRWARFLSVLAIVLPVPMLAALGLSLPLPATVERLAAKLVPFGDPSALDSSGTQSFARGSIVGQSGTQLGSQPASSAPVGSPGALRGKGSPARSASRVAVQPTTGGARNQVARQNGDRPHVASSPPANASAPAVSGGGGSIPNPGTHPDPGPTPPPTPTQVVDTVLNTVTTATAPVTDAAKPVTAPVTTTASNTLGGIHPP